MIRKLLVVIVVGTLFSLFACAPSGSMIGAADEERDEITMVGTPTADEPAPENLKGIVEKYLVAHPKWEGTSSEGSLFVQFDSAKKEVSILSLKSNDLYTTSFEVSEDGEIVASGDRYLFDLSLKTNELTVTDKLSGFSSKTEISTYPNDIKGRWGVEEFNADTDTKDIVNIKNGLNPDKVNILLFKAGDL